MGPIARAFERHKLMRRLLVAWACALITWVIFQVFKDPAIITPAINAAMTIVVGILSTVIGFYQYLRDKEDKAAWEDQ